MMAYNSSYDMMNSTASTLSLSSDYVYLYDDYEPCSTDTTITLGSNFLPVLFSLVFVVGLAGNSVVLLILIKHIRLKNMTDVCLLNLAISDLLFVLSLPFWAYYTSDHEIVSTALCKAIVGLYQIGFYSSVLFVTLMSIDRYLAIVHAVFAMRARTLCFGVVASIGIWTVAICGSIPAMAFNKVVAPESTTCQPEYPIGEEKIWKLIHNFEDNVLGLIIPLPIMIYCYVSILIVLLRSRNSKRHRAIKLIFMVVCVFVVFRLPYNVVVFMKSLQEFGIGDKCENAKRIELALQLTETVALIHCCVNPFIYAFVGEKFRKHMNHMFSRFSLCAYFCKQTSIHMKVSENETSNTPL
ncbi:C-C chemokine receptor type 4 [Lepisosteus oculatus]|uniref:C-C chemokine receptor type 4 n=1 Tax=Lepisosteus oculatus TaxID=7918 RepID=UPI0035F50C60